MTGITDAPSAIVLGTVLHERVRLRNMLISLPRPIGKASKAVHMNVGGKERIMEITCRKTGTIAQLKAFVDSVDDWADTDYQSSATYTSVLGHARTVFCEDFDYDIDSEAPNILIYDLTMKEGGSISDQFS